MKNLLILLICLSSFLLNSCEASSQVILPQSQRELYYDIGTNYVIVYYGGLPYYKYWYNDRWFYSVVPRSRFPYIRRWTPEPIRPMYPRLNYYSKPNPLHHPHPNHKGTGYRQGGRR